MDWTAIYGYWVLAGDTIIIVTSLGLLVICNFGFSVYHVAMWRNSHGNLVLRLVRLQCKFLSGNSHFDLQI